MVHIKKKKVYGYRFVVKGSVRRGRPSRVWEDQG